MQPIVIKLSGHQIDDPEFLTEFAQTVRALETPVIIVHGGGKEITAMQETLAVETKYVDGIRITDETTLTIVQMVLGGSVNKRLVSHLIYAGLDAVGMSGVDRGAVRAVKMPNATQDMGLTGQVTTVRGEIFTDLLEKNITPVLAPFCLGEDANVTYNVNGDHVTGAVAAAVNASRVIFISNVEAVLVEEQPIHHLNPSQVQAMIEDGTIYGGMIPKVQMALHVLENGVPEAVITNLTGLKTHGGTIFTKEAVLA